MVASVGNVDAAIRTTRGHRPDVLVLDLNMPGGSSLDAIPTILAASPTTQIAVLTMQNEPAFARQALGAGALAYVLKEAADDELVEAIRRVAVGETYLNPPARRADGSRSGYRRPGPGRPLRARGRGAAPDRARAHERRDRSAALSLDPNGR